MGRLLAKGSGETLEVVQVGNVEWNRKLGLELRSEMETFGEMMGRFLELIGGVGERRLDMVM